MDFSFHQCRKFLRWFVLGPRGSFLRDPRYRLSEQELEVSFGATAPVRTLTLRSGRDVIAEVPLTRSGDRFVGTLPLAALSAGNYELFVNSEAGYSLRLHEGPVGLFGQPLAAAASSVRSISPEGSPRVVELLRSPTTSKLRLAVGEGIEQSRYRTSAVLTTTHKRGDRLVVRGLVVSVCAPDRIESLFLVARKGAAVDEWFELGDVRLGRKRLIGGRTFAPFRAVIDVRELHDAGAFSERQCHPELGVRYADGLQSKHAIRPLAGSKYKRLYGEVIHSFRRAGWASDVGVALTRAGSLTLGLRTSVPEDRLPFRLKELAALVLFAFFGRRRKKSWVLYEAFSNTAQDNAFVFFEWLKTQRIPQEAYYVLRKDSPQAHRLRAYQDSVLEYGSFRHLFEMLRCEALVSSQGRDHCYVFRGLPGSYKRHILSRPLIFLQHGVTAFKKSNFKKKVRSPTRSSLVLAVSEAEKALIVEHWGYEPDEVAVTGFPRFDVLEDKSTRTARKEILVMPTWRSWLSDLSPEDFRASDFFRAYQGLLDSPDVHRWLEEEDAVLLFVGHVRIAGQSGVFASPHPRIRLVPTGDEPVNELLMRGAVLVTDYSSVAWDFYYMQKPVVFYRFDLDKYLRVHGSHVDLRQPSFGKLAEDPEQLLALLKESISMERAPVNPEAFRYNDRDNCRRAYEAILRIRPTLRN